MEKVTESEEKISQDSLLTVIKRNSSNEVIFDVKKVLVQRY